MPMTKEPRAPRAINKPIPSEQEILEAVTKVRKDICEHYGHEPEPEYLQLAEANFVRAHINYKHGHNEVAYLDIRKIYEEQVSMQLAANMKDDTSGNFITRAQELVRGSVADNIDRALHRGPQR